MTDSDEYLTVEQLADLLQMSRWTIYNYVGRGQIPFVRSGPRNVRFRRRDIERWLDNSVKPRTAATAG